MCVCVCGGVVVDEVGEGGRGWKEVVMLWGSREV